MKRPTHVNLPLVAVRDIVGLYVDPPVRALVLCVDEKEPDPSQLRERDADGSEANPIQFRIGINVGDIIIEGEDILGDGVNIAARIEGIAEPGGISISEDAWRQVQGKVAANFVDGGAWDADAAFSAKSNR